LGTVLDLIFPENLYCMCCDDLIDNSRIHGICDSCIEKIVWTVENPYKSAMDEFSFDDVLACCIYGFYPRRIIHGLKLNGQTYVAKGLGKLMAERAMLSPDKYDMLIPVPSTKKKDKKRGFNQAQLLAKYAARELGLPLEEKILYKRRETASMRTSTGTERRFLLQNVFDTENTYRILGKNILLVDDVITTGSTADECARVLKAAGCAKVSILCFACTGMYML
jgi:competence protein ComFC